MLLGLLFLEAWAGADELPSRPSARLLAEQPELARPGACVMVREGGQGKIITGPIFWLKGTVLEGAVLPRRLERCPEVPGKSIERYSREEFNRLAKARPCVSRDDLVHEEKLGMVRLRVEAWETPWAKTAANSGRLFQGHFIDRALHEGLELEIEADLLDICP